jgi:hypothetical protein
MNADITTMAVLSLSDGLQNKNIRGGQHERLVRMCWYKVVPVLNLAQQ